MNINAVKNLLESTKKTIDKHEKIEKAKGDKFNIFSILKMEKKEDETHSPFLGELLNPKGTHLKGKTFLNKFLDHIKDDTLDRNNVQVVLEKYIGPKNLKKKRGGRIDIYLWDDKGNTISIENKLDAPEQEAQVARYCNHNKDKNKVYYLTLWGTEPSDFSKGIKTESDRETELQSGDDFFLLSYSQDIIEWLEACMKEAFDDPIVRESIKQYSILIQKITNQMDDQQKKELQKYILLNFEAAEHISSHMTEARKLLAEEIRQGVVRQLEDDLNKDEFLVEAGNNAFQKYSQVFIKLKTHPESTLCFGLESFSGDAHFNGRIYAGICNSQHNYTPGIMNKTKFKFYLWNWWINLLKLPHLDGFEINFSHAKLIQELYTSSDFKKRMINHISNETQSYIEQEYAELIAYLESDEHKEILEQWK